MGELVLGPKLGWRGAAWGAFFGTLPDLDVIVLPFLDAAAGIRWHRGLSHSILVMVVASLILARPVARCHRAAGVTAGEAGRMIFLAWSTHVLIDCLTTYGTQIFEPFSSARVAMNVMFIVDPLFTLPLLVGLWWALRLPRESGKRRKVMGIGVFLSSFFNGIWKGTEPVE
jgi:inner membrane protein